MLGQRVTQTKKLFCESFRFWLNSFDTIAILLLIKILILRDLMMLKLLLLHNQLLFYLFRRLIKWSRNFVTSRVNTNFALTITNYSVCYFAITISFDIRSCSTINKKIKIRVPDIEFIFILFIPLVG